MDLSKFRKPDSILRPAPFCAINDRITPEETARQIGDMIDVGLSGGFFHSRAGLITDYLSDEWFDSMSAAIEVAREKDGYVWLYDEDLWPSGNAGGQVAGMKDDYRAATLNATILAAGEPVPADSDDESLRVLYVLKHRNGIKLEQFEQVPVEKAREYQDTERLILKRQYQPKTGWWGGESYANLMDPEAMKKFVEMTHEVYYKKLGEEFGKRVPGIFTDEPQLANTHVGIAWYEGFPALYDRWTGRSFWNDLPYMFFEGPESRRIRLLVHRMILRQFVEAYSKPMYEWCERHGTDYTGHYMAEDSFHSQILCHCGGVMAHYRYQHIPGIDHLCRATDPMLFTVKQVSSAARQLGRTRVLTEIFGVSRHTNTFEDFKWIGDYNLVLGANFFCPHLTWYSARGRRKRDYPPNWNYQQTYWKELNPLNDYFTRVAYALTSGKSLANVLLLHSIESATAAHRLGVRIGGEVKDGAKNVPVDVPTEDFGAAFHLDGMLRKTLDAILNAGYDCDLGDEGYIEDMGSVSDGKFVIGEMAYDVVVVPPSTTWRPKTYELLKEFQANGGKIVFVGDFPYEIDCDPANDKWIELAGSENAQTVPSGVHHIQEAMDEAVSPTFSLRGADGKPVQKTYLQHRVDGDQQIFFIINSDRAKESEYVLKLFGAGGKNVYSWNPLDGSVDSVKAEETGHDLIYRFTLPPCGSILLTVGGIVDDVRHTEELPYFTNGTIIPLPKTWRHERLDPNVLVLDRLDASLDGAKTWMGEDLEFRVRKRLAEHFGTANALMWQPWVAIRKGVFEGKGGPVTLKYRFTSDIENPKSAYLVMEDLQKGKVKFNGQDLDLSDAGWHWDKGFGKVDVASLIRKGENVVEYSVDYDFLTEIEAAYIVGDFGVALASPYEGKLVEETEQLDNGSWVNQTYPFYSGRMVYETDFDGKAGVRTFLKLNNPSGILYKIRVNDEEVGKILWRPFEIDLTPYIQDGRNELEIEVVSSLQNSWGPLHERHGDDNMWVGPDAFEDEKVVRNELSLFNYGLLGGAELVED